MNTRQLIESLTASDVAKAAKDTDRNPTDKQKEAGSYKMGNVEIQGLKISIENAKGSYRSGTDKSGKEWRCKMPAHYGYINGTVGKDKDHVDVWIGPSPQSPLVWVINQQRADSKAFDEHKCMIGFKSKEDAVRAYDEAYQGGLGKKLRQTVTATSMEGFKDWLKNGSQNKPFVYESARRLVEEDETSWFEQFSVGRDSSGIAYDSDTGSIFTTDTIAELLVEIEWEGTGGTVEEMGELRGEIRSKGEVELRYILSQVVGASGTTDFELAQGLEKRYPHGYITNWNSDFRQWGGDEPDEDQEQWGEDEDQEL